jgi:biotin operon repressor
MGVTLMDAGIAAWHWLEGGGRRAPLRAALTRHWVLSGLLRAPLPLTGAAALRAEVDWDLPGWTRAFLEALADEADDILNLLYELERGWDAARRAVAGHRRHSHTPRAVDLLAAVPLISATTLARALGISIKSALAILDALRRDGIAVEVTGRAARRLFGLAGLAPLAAVVAPPRRPEPGRGPGRPRHLPPLDEAAPPPLTQAAPFAPAAWQAFDYSDLDAAMAAVDAAIRGARRGLERLAGGSGADSPDPDGVDERDDDGLGDEAGTRSTYDG